MLEPAALGRIAGDEVEDDKVLRSFGENDGGCRVDKEKSAHQAGDASDLVVGNVKQRAVRVGEDLAVAVRPDLERAVRI